MGFPCRFSLFLAPAVEATVSDRGARESNAENIGISCNYSRSKEPGTQVPDARVAAG
jgi:hypothetical protein